MRRALLIRSAQELVGSGGVVSNAVYMWRRHDLWLVFTIATAVAVLLVGQLFDFEAANLAALAFLLAILAAGASTRYFVLAKTEQTIFLMTGSPIRRVARQVVKDDLTVSHITSAGNTLLATDWTVDGQVYTVPKSCEQDMQAIIA